MSLNKELFYLCLGFLNIYEYTSASPQLGCRSMCICQYAKSADVPIVAQCFRYNWSDPQLAYALDSNGTDDLMRHIAFTLNDTFIGCFIAGAFVPCWDVMKPVRTDAGNVVEIVY